MNKLPLFVSLFILLTFFVYGQSGKTKVFDSNGTPQVTDIATQTELDALSSASAKIATANTFTENQKVIKSSLPALTVSQTSGMAASLTAGGAAGVFSFDAAGSFGIGSATNSNVINAPGSTETWRMWIQGSDGKIGIGTTSPSALVDINSNILRLRTSKTPSSASDTGNAGDWCWDADYIYVCVATNTWKRANLTSW